MRSNATRATAAEASIFIVQYWVVYRVTVEFVHTPYARSDDINEGQLVNSEGLQSDLISSYCPSFHPLVQG